LCRNIGTNDQYTLRNIAEERISHLCLSFGINNIHIQVDRTIGAAYAKKAINHKFETKK